jgi:hypothetical protein
LDGIACSQSDVFEHEFRSGDADDDGALVFFEVLVDAVLVGEGRNEAVEIEIEVTVRYSVFV